MKKIAALACFAILLLVLLFLLMRPALLPSASPEIILGSDSGFKSPSASGDDASIGTVGPWTNTDNIFASDDVRASQSVGTLCNHKLTSAKLIKAGSITGNEKAADETFNTLDTTLTYGGATDVWGVTLMPSDVNTSTFGFGAAVKANNGVITHYITATNFSFGIPATATINGVEVTVEGGCLTATARVDYMSMKVYYTDQTQQHSTIFIGGGSTSVTGGTTIIP